MALTGHKKQGYAIITESTASDGTVTETLSGGKLTSHVVSFSANRGTSEQEYYAGDQLEESELDTTGTLSIELSGLSLEDEAALGGHDYTTGTMTESEEDAPPYVRYGAIGVGRNNGTVFYRVVKVYKAKFTPADENLATKQRTVTFSGHSLSGSFYPNCDGNIRAKSEFTTYESALADLKTFLGIS